MILAKGNIAPDFVLFATPDQKLRLDDLKGQCVILAFYPADWSPVCGDQMALYNETLTLFNRFKAQVIGISVDSRWCHMAFSESRKLHFPLLSDFEPREPFQDCMDPIMKVVVKAKEPFLLLTKMELFNGVIFLRMTSTPELMGSWMHWKNITLKIENHVKIKACCKCSRSSPGKRQRLRNNS